MLTADNWIEVQATALVRRGAILTLLGWLPPLSAGQVRGQGKTQMALAWGLALAMRFDEALERLRDIEARIIGETSAGSSFLQRECRVVRSVLAALMTTVRPPCVSPNPV